jgi:hypothetical protein
MDAKGRKAVKTVKKSELKSASDPETILSLLSTLETKGTARFKAAKELQLISRENPGLLYPYFEVFASLLSSPSSVLLWNALIILSFLATIDNQRRFDKIIDKYYSHLWDGKLVTAANVLVNSGRVAKARPDLAERITAELLKAEEIPLPTDECREVARGHVLTSLAEYIDVHKSDQTVREFIIHCTTSHRPAVKERAQALYKKF